MTPDEKYQDAPRVCPSTAYVTPGGEPPRSSVTPVVRCTLLEGHGGPHGIWLGWDDDGIDWPEAHDPDEDFDVEVDVLPHDEAVDAVIDSETVGDDLVIEHSHEAIDETVRERVDLQRRYGDGPTAACGVEHPDLVGHGLRQSIACVLPRGHAGRHSLE